ncbi:T9SS-dependent choice-of-anchor J family protein [Chryseobacterium oryctis]|uniref:T9SS type A sorting domain-containing protein n=1 Tax=Chryseobacterium oryctis TaxID=2952618 RepID=A0ABT3HSI5_9FLAO|nr:T9SS type A sorting domain-containing protein [Chryseobacterium oryctis]MCW3162738.1 T9SS type A sorting domain-containing protein [Chryseobacterium oryctis]
MKKLFLLFIIFLSQSIFAQFPVWSNSFDTPNDLQGWTFHDLNGNGNGWVQGQNIYYNGTQLAYGTAGVLRYSMSLVPTGSAPSFATENDWVISPQIDLTGAGGTLTLAAYIGRQRSNHLNLGRDLYIFVSTPAKEVPELSDFQAMAVDNNGNSIPTPYKLLAGTSTNPFPNDLTQFAECTVDISAFAGKKIYIGMWSNRRANENNIQNINIDEMAIYSSVLKTNETNTGKALTKILENPVKNSLQLKLNSGLKESNTLVNIYNMAGQKIFTSKYSKNINVNQLSVGTYIAVISDGNITEKLKFIKN